MRAVVAAAAALAGIALPVASAAPPAPKPIPPIHLLPVDEITAQARPATAGARPAEIRLTLRLELQCGSLGSSPVVVRFPAAVRLPRSLPPESVRVGAAPPRSVSVRGGVVSLATPRRVGLTCDEIGPAVVSVVFTKAANLGNPARPGGYRVTVRAAGQSGVATLRVKT